MSACVLTTVKEEMHYKHPSRGLQYFDFHTTVMSIFTSVRRRYVDKKIYKKWLTWENVVCTDTNVHPVDYHALPIPTPTRQAL
jgi:hypothetical protein